MRIPLTVESRIVFTAVIFTAGFYGVSLFFFPAETPFYWAWDLTDARSAILIGGGYLAATTFLIFALMANDWRQAQNGIAGFVAVSLVFLYGTSFDWDLFRPYHPTTLIWLITYYLPPLLIPIIFRVQKRVGGAGMAGREARIAPAWRVWLGVRGFFYLGLALFGLLFTPTLASVWPWPIKLLDLRVFMAWVTIVGWGGVGAVMSGLEWPRYRLGLVGTAAIGVLEFVGLFISAAPYNWSSAGGVLLPLVFLEWAVTALIMLFIYRKR